MRFWRVFSDTHVEWKNGPWTLAVAYDIGMEQAVEQTDHPGQFWTSGVVFVRWNISRPWSLGFRPEVYWDRDGRLTGASQLITAVTLTSDYAVRLGRQTGLLRLEYRFDRSTGSQGGYFTGEEIAPGVNGLTPNQNLLMFGLLWWFDS